MNPNSDQIQSAIRWLMTLSGPIGAYLVAKGVTVESLSSVVSAIIVIAGAIPPIISLIWSIKSNSDAANLKTVLEMDDVKRIVPVKNPDPKGAVAKAAKDPEIKKIVKES